MRKFAMLTGLAVVLAASVPAEAGVCLQFTRIGTTKAIDPHTILFRMKDGTVWRNTLRSACPGAMSGGISYFLQTDDICENAQVIHVLDTGESCLLGSFTKDAPAHHG